MKQTNWSKISEIYRQNGYSDEIVANIECLESQYPFLEEVLERYRCVQPDEEMFTEHSLKLIMTLLDIENMLEVQEDIIYEINCSLKKLVKLSFDKCGPLDDFHPDEDVF